MADLSDVEQGLLMLLAGALYPGGPTGASACGFTVRLFRGFPNPLGLNADLTAGVATVSIFSDPRDVRETSRYPRAWREMPRPVATLTAEVAGSAVIFGGTVTAGEIVGVLADGAAFTYVALATDTPETIASALAASIPGASAENTTVTVGGVSSLLARVETCGSAMLELRRQEQSITVSLWCSTPLARDTLAIAVDGTLAAVDWLKLPDGTSGLLRYQRTVETDTSEKANLYRRDLVYGVDYPTTRTVTVPPMVFGQLARAAAIDVATSPPAPLLGAIRFDAWYAPTDTIDSQCAAALAPPQWSMRWPPNAIAGDGTLAWPAATQATIDAEILAALAAGLDFWAFDSYPPGDGLMSALPLFLGSTVRGSLRFCMLGQISNWADATATDGYAPILDRDIAMMAEPAYLLVTIGGSVRPVYFVLDAPDAALASLPTGAAGAIAAVRAKAANAGIGNPYVIWLSGAPIAEYDNASIAAAVGADAAGAYSCPAGPVGATPYETLMASTAADWTGRAATGFPMVPTAMSGWDPRPLIENPQPFYPVPTTDNDADYYLGATPTALGDHVAAMLDFLGDNPVPCASAIGLIYAWNELAEGGWIMPTLGSAAPDTTRVTAIGAATGAWRRRQLASNYTTA